MPDTKEQADLLVELMRRVDRIEAGTCSAECLKELGLLSLRLASMKAKVPYHELLYSLIGEAQANEHQTILASRGTQNAFITQH